MPDLTSLDLFVGAVELGSLTRAAEAHGMSQPSASSRIRRLEHQLGVQLLVRSPRGSKPTRQGALIAAWAQQLLEAARQFNRGVASLGERESARLRVVASQTNAEHVLPVALGLIPASSTPELTVGNSSWVISMLRDGRADLGFIETPSVPTGFRSSTVATDEVIVVAPSGHPWSRRSSRQRSIATLAATPLLTREVGSGTREAFERALRTLGARAVKPRMELGSNAALRAALLGGVSPGVISRLVVESDLATGALVEVRFADLEVRRSLRAIWLQERALPAHAAALVATLSRALQAGH